MAGLENKKSQQKSSEASFKAPNLKIPNSMDLYKLEYT